jgi:hypothetical protein
LRILAERRLELLKMEGKGFNEAEIVKHLSEKYQCTTRNIYRDFELRGEWQPTLTQMNDAAAALLKVRNRFEQIYREAAFIKLGTTNENAQIGALRVMLEANAQLLESVEIQDLDQRITTLEQEKTKPNQERALMLTSNDGGTANEK